MLVGANWNKDAASGNGRVTTSQHFMANAVEATCFAWVVSAVAFATNSCVLRLTLAAHRRGSTCT